MITTITQFDRLATDEAGNLLPIGKLGLASQSRTGAGAFTALDPSCNFMRVASDTAVSLTDAAGRVLFIAPNVPEYFAVGGGDVFTLATV